MLKLYSLILIILSGLFSSEVFSQSRIDDHEQLKLDIERRLRPDQFKSVLIGQNETLIVIHESNLAISKGAAILISETGRSGASQLALAPLAPYLADFGWTTIMVSAPPLDFESDLPEDLPPIPISPPASTETPDNASEDSETEQPEQESQQTEPSTDSTQQNPAGTMSSSNIPPPNQAVPSYTSTPIISEQLFQQQQQAFQLLMNALEQERSEYPGFFLLIAQGTSAAWLAGLYVDGTLQDQPDALVTLGVNWPQHDLNQQLPDLLAETPFPVLDIYNQFDSDWTKRTAQQRKVAAVKSLKLHFRQREIIGPRYDHYQHEYLSREIHGWLTYMGW